MTGKMKEFSKNSGSLWIEPKKKGMPVEWHPFGKGRVMEEESAPVINPFGKGGKLGRGRNEFNREISDGGGTGKVPRYI